MQYSAADLRKYAKLKRTRANLETVRDVVADMSNDVETLSEWAEAGRELREKINEFLDKQERLDEDMVHESIVSRINAGTDALLDLLPDEGDVLEQLEEARDTAESDCDELESMLDDNDYGAEERDEKWYEITDGLETMAQAIDAVGTPVRKNTGD